MVPGVPREAQQLVCVCANEFGGAADRGEYRQGAGVVAQIGSMNADAILGQRLNPGANEGRPTPAELI